jgi:HSP90 family molecular chaperone
MFDETYKGHVFKTLDMLMNGHEVLYLTEAVDEYAGSALPESEKKKFLYVAKEGFHIDDDTDAVTARKDVVNEKYGPLEKCQGKDSLEDHSEGRDTGHAT